MPPPSLLTTTTVRGIPVRRAWTSAPRSWRKARSPTRATVGALLAAATPSAVLRVPSMPFTPRLESTRIVSALLGPKASTSRTGMLLATTSRAPSGSEATTARATAGSESRPSRSSAAASAASAARSARRKPSAQVARRGAVAAARATHSAGRSPSSTSEPGVAGRLIPTLGEGTTSAPEVSAPEMSGAGLAEPHHQIRARAAPSRHTAAAVEVGTAAIRSPSERRSPLRPPADAVNRPASAAVAGRPGAPTAPPHQAPLGSGEPHGGLHLGGKREPLPGPSGRCLPAHPGPRRPGRGRLCIGGGRAARNGVEVHRATGRVNRAAWSSHHPGSAGMRSRWSRATVDLGPTTDRTRSAWGASAARRTRAAPRAVSGERDQWDARQASISAGRMRPGGAPVTRPPRAHRLEGQTEGEEAGHPLVEDHPGPEGRGRLGAGQGEGAVPRPRGEHHLPDACPMELLDDGRSPERVERGHGVSPPPRARGT
jgi:hypothetical protein